MCVAADIHQAHAPLKNGLLMSMFIQCMSKCHCKYTDETDIDRLVEPVYM